MYSKKSKSHDSQNHQSPEEVGEARTFKFYMSSDFEAKGGKARFLEIGI